MRSKDDIVELVDWLQIKPPHGPKIAQVILDLQEMLTECRTASYKQGINEIEQAKEIERLTDENRRKDEALTVLRQFMGEVAHAHQSGPGWYTRGEQGLRSHIWMWIDRAKKALDSAASTEQDS